jgi:prepilin-type N-terminal cleavage/methylation domain-containing protein
MASRSRAALTLIELLVVIAVVGILAGLLLPAIVQSRSAARRTQCGANLKQLAHAVQGFHERMDRLPVYWGSMKGGDGEVFGGWLLHLLPELDQQAAYDQMLPFGTLTGTITASGTTVVTNPGFWQDTFTTVVTGTIPARPPSADYKPERMEIRHAIDNQGTPYPYPVVIPPEGDPGEAEQVISTPVVTGSVWVPASTTTIVTPGVDTRATLFGRLSPEHDNVTSALSLPVLLDMEDSGPLRSNARNLANPLGYENAPLTNYQINAHVLMKFGPRYILDPSGTTVRSGAWAAPATAVNREWAGYFPPPPRAEPGERIGGTWNHLMSGTCGPVGRNFRQVADGLSNTLLFAEAMRQCDAGLVFRHAFLPSGPSGTAVSPRWFNEHAFGILPSLRGAVPSAVPGVLVSGTARADIETFGHTLMFQTQPSMLECNPTRVQAIHGTVLMTAMCDGSVRAIASGVSRREPVGAAACGRVRFGSTRGDFQSRGGQAPRTDGVWDILMVPNDPPENVLSNTGEVGRERGPNDPPL